MSRARQSVLRVVVFAIFTLALLFARSANAQQSFVSENKVWSFTMPDGWQVMSLDQITKLKAQYKAAMPDNPSRMVVGFTKTARSLFPYPQVIVQVLDTNMGGMQWS